MPVSGHSGERIGIVEESVSGTSRSGLRRFVAVASGSQLVSGRPSDFNRETYGNLVRNVGMLLDLPARFHSARNRAIVFPTCLRTPAKPGAAYREKAICRSALSSFLRTHSITRCRIPRYVSSVILQVQDGRAPQRVCWTSS